MFNSFARNSGHFGDMPTFFKFWFAFVFMMVFAIMALGATLTFETLTHPEQVGEFIGKIYHGFNGAR